MGKAIAQSKVPTITCTSSNVVQTILQSTSQLEGDVDVYYGPDAYMGANIKEMLEQLLQTTDEDVRRIHPAHHLAAPLALPLLRRRHLLGARSLRSFGGAIHRRALRRRVSDGPLRSAWRDVRKGAPCEPQRRPWGHWFDSEHPRFYSCQG